MSLSFFSRFSSSSLSLSSSSQSSLWRRWKQVRLHCSCFRQKQIRKKLCCWVLCLSLLCFIWFRHLWVCRHAVPRWDACRGCQILCISITIRYRRNQLTFVYTVTVGGAVLCQCCAVLCHVYVNLVWAINVARNSLCMYSSLVPRYPRKNYAKGVWWLR